MPPAEPQAAEPQDELFAGLPKKPQMTVPAEATRSIFARTGILPSQAIRAMIAGGEIFSAPEIEANQIQPASLDLRLGKVAYRIRASFLPGPNATVRDKLDELKFHEIDLTKGAVFEAGCVYLVPLIEQLKLRSTIAGFANPKSSTGRLDVFTRLIADRQEVSTRSRKAIRGRSSPRSARAPSPSRSATARASTRSDSAAASASSSMPASSRAASAIGACAKSIPMWGWSRAMPPLTKD